MAWMKSANVGMLAGVLTLVSTGFEMRAQQFPGLSVDLPDTVTSEHAECLFFGPKHDQYVQGGQDGPGLGPKGINVGMVTDAVMRQISVADNSLGVVPGGSRTSTYERANAQGTIDRYIFQAIQDAAVTPAARATDYEFIRRVTLDLTGRIPTPARVQSFVADTSTDKRAKLIEELLAKPEWVDKWVMYYGDQFNNTVANTTTGVRRFADGRNAFYTWLKGQIAANTPYNQIAAAIIKAQGTNSYDPTQAQINWTVNGLVTNGPAQDAYDQMAANTAETFLGISHLNCTLCHNGRGHLDTLSLWGANESRVTSWGMAAYFAKTQVKNTPVDPANKNVYYWSVLDAGKNDYALNTLTGNRPARCLNNQPPVVVNNVTKCAATGTATPVYPFTGKGPNPGEDYREALARQVTSDFQFARATVNYIWKEFFALGLVDPVNQFDVARQDPDNPPPAPWTLQASNPRLLNALAQDFINSGYDLKALMREITNSDAYQLSARYSGTAPPDNLFARKLVRRLWAEEIHDAIAQSSNMIPSYNVIATPSSTAVTKISWAMQLPDTNGLPGGTVAAFLDAFLRGNRDDQDRLPDSSLSQALDLMDDPFVGARIKATGTAAAGNQSLLAQALAQTSDQQLVNLLFMNVLSRPPSASELQTAVANLASVSTAALHQQKAENLLWSLYNKVDFIFNY
jgi:hypothetical protein